MYTNPLAAAFFSLLVPGLGQLYNGQLKKAIIYYLLILSVIPVFIFTDIAQFFWGVVALIGFRLLVNLISLVDAYIVSVTMQDRTLRMYNRWYIYMLIVLITIMLSNKTVNYIKSNYFRAFRITTGSMEPTLFINDFILADLQYYKHNLPKTGDLITFISPKNPGVELIKRVIAIQGQTVKIRKKVVYVDGKMYQDSGKVVFSPDINRKPFPSNPFFPNKERRIDNNNYGPEKVPQNMCFVLGDNRDNTLDSRHFGFVPLDSIIGKPLYIYWSKDNNRIGTILE